MLMKTPMQPAEKVEVLRHTLTFVEMEMAKLGKLSDDPVRAKLQMHFLDNIGMLEKYPPAAERIAEKMGGVLNKAIKRSRRRGRPASGKVRLNLLVDPAVLEAFKATGPGWQARVNETLLANLPR